MHIGREVFSQSIVLLSGKIGTRYYDQRLSSFPRSTLYADVKRQGRQGKRGKYHLMVDSPPLSALYMCKERGNANIFQYELLYNNYYKYTIGIYYAIL